MAGLLPPVVATLLADTKDYSAKMDQATGKMDKLGAASETTGQKMNNFANKASTAILGAGVAVAAISVKMAADFQSSMTALVTGAGEAQKNIAMVSKGILAMAGVVGQTPAALAQGMYLIESAGFHGAAGLSVLKASAEGAAVGTADMAVVANAVTTALHDYHIPASRANEVTSALIETVARGKTHLSDLATSLGKSMPVASALGISFQQVTGAIAAMTNAGMSARFASTHLQTSLLALSAPSKVAMKSMADVGLTAQQVKDVLANPKEGLAGAMKLIEDHVGHTFPANSVAAVTAFKNIMGGATGYATALMLGGKNAASFNANVAAIGNVLSKASPQVQGFSKVQKDLNFQLQSFKASGSAALINIGDWLLPKATAVAKWANGVFAYFKAHPLISKIASDAAIGTFAAALAYKLGRGLVTAFNAVKSIFTGTAITANTTATQLNTDALLGRAGLGGVGGAALGGEIGMGIATKAGLIGAAIGLGVLAYTTGKPGQTTFNKASAEWQKNKVGGAADMGILTVDTLSGAMNHVLGWLPGHPQIPQIPVIGPDMSGQRTKVPGRNADRLGPAPRPPSKKTLTVNQFHSWGH